MDAEDVRGANPPLVSTRPDFTPGPWTLKEVTEQYHTVGAQIIGSTIGPLGGKLPIGYVDSSMADARLIAAAPDLLDALERLLATTVFLDELGVGPAVKRCHAAVKKARGES